MICRFNDRNIGKNNPNYGRVWTKEMRLRLSLKKMGLL